MTALRRSSHQNVNREMFEESVGVLFKAFEGQAVLALGQILHEEITLVPAPERLPVEY